jgi:hypothetical protein
MYRLVPITTAVFVALACDNGRPIENTPTVKLSLSLVDGAKPSPTGLFQPVSVVATADSVPVSGLTVTLASSATGVTFTPATAITDSSGHAISAVVVPYGTTILGVATSPGNGSDEQTIPAASLEIGLGSNATEVITGGRLLTLVATAQSDGQAVQGVSLSFSTNTSGVTIAPSPAVTDLHGCALVQVPVQYSAATLTAQVTGGNAVKVVSLSQMLPALHVQVKSSSGIAIGSAATGSNYQIDATVTDDEKNTVAGIAVGFAEYGVSTGSNLFQPSSTTTGSDGVATSFITFAGTLDIVLTVAGVAHACAVPADTGVECL